MPSSSVVTRENYTSQNALRLRRLWLLAATPLSTSPAAANYRRQSASHVEGGGRRSAPGAEMVGRVLRPAHERFSIAWAGRGGAEELSEAEAPAGGAGKGAGPEEGETLKRKQQQAEPL